jgi:Na+/phosphate symporter
MSNKSKIKLEFEIESFNELQEMVELVQKQVSYLWQMWDKKSTESQKMLMELIHNNPNELPTNLEDYFNDKDEMVLFTLSTKDLYWKFINGLERLKQFQKAYDKFNYNMSEPFEENRYGLHWMSN